MKNNAPNIIKARAITWLATVTTVLFCATSLSTRAETKEELQQQLAQARRERDAAVAKSKKLEAELARKEEQAKISPATEGGGASASNSAKPGQTKHIVAPQSVVEAAVKGAKPNAQDKSLIQQALKKLDAKEDSESVQKARRDLDAAMEQSIKNSPTVSTQQKLFLIHRNVLPQSREVPTKDKEQGTTIFHTEGFITGSLLGLKHKNGEVDESRIGNDVDGWFGNRNTHFGSIGNSIHIRESLDNLKAFQMTLDEDILRKGGTPADAVFAVSDADTQGIESDFASFNYKNNRQTHSTGWNAKGVIYLPMTLVNSDGKPTSLLNYIVQDHSSWSIFYPAVRFERDTSKDSTKTPVNALDFLIGADFNFYDQDPSLPVTDTERSQKDSADLTHLSWVVHAAVGAHTDFSFSSVKPLYELTYTPVYRTLNAYNRSIDKQGDGNRSPGERGVAYKIILQGVGLATENVTDTKNSKKGDSTLPLGIDAGFGLKAHFGNDFWDRAEFQARYQARWDTRKDNKYNGLFSASLILPTISDETSQTAWSIDYRKGDDLTTFDKVDEIAVSLKVKF